VNWRQKLDTTKGAVLATEIKNNNCKIAKWTAQSLLSNVAFMKLGYVSRSATTNATDHQILGTQSVRPKELATQLGMNLINIWGIVKMFCETILSKPDGKYLIMKDPNRPIVRLYSVPLSAFEDVEEYEEEGGENEGVEEDDQNVAVEDTA
jgi:translation initiation factor 3 subunit D